MADSALLTQVDLISRLLASLPAGYTAATVKLPNAAFTTPSKTKWLRVTNLFNETVNATPDGYKRTFGIFVIDIFFPLGSGDQQQLTDSEAIKLLFENEEFGNTKTQEVSTVLVGEENSWYNLQLNVNYYYEGA